MTSQLVRSLLSLEVDENTEITSFSETPAKPTIAKDLTEAEEEVRQVEDENKKDDEVYREQQSEKEAELLATQFFAEMDYGTPGSFDCPGCCPANQDAGDVALIDASIEPAEPSDSEGTDVDTELRTYFLMDKCLGRMFSGKFSDASYQETQYFKTLIKTHPQAGMEDWIDHASMKGQLADQFAIKVLNFIQATAIISMKVLKACFSITKKTAKLLGAGYKTVRNRMLPIMKNSTKVVSFWDKKLSKLVTRLDPEKMREQKIEAFPYQEFVKVSKAIIKAHDLVSQAESYADKDNADSQMMQIINTLEAAGIRVNAATGKIDNLRLSSKRKVGTIVELGYTPDHLPECIAISREVAKRSDNADVSPMEKSIAHLQSLVSKKLDVQKKLATKKVLKDDREKDIVKQAVETDVRIRYITQAAVAISATLNTLMNDLMHICAACEKSLSKD